ncbi:FAD-binding oxidoreductase [archaeon]|nr:FAD-binding oxidoreductase [archaeon]
MASSEEITRALIDALGPEKVLHELPDLMPYSRDWSPRPETIAYLPIAVVLPSSTEDVATVVRLANQMEFVVIPFGGGTGMGGGAVPLEENTVIIDMKSMNRVLEIDIPNRVIRVQAGITIEKINEALEPYGYWFPHDPESKPASTIGAAIACDNDSTFGIRYGKIVTHLLNVVVVTGDGRILRLGHRKAHCSSTGYKLHWLLIGSEGTLAIITEVTLAIYPKPRSRAVLMYVFPSIDKAVRAIEEAIRAGIPIESANIGDRYRLHFYTHAYRTKYGQEPSIPEWAKAIVGLSIAGDPKVVRFHARYLSHIFRRFGGRRVREQEIVESWWASKHTLAFEPFKQKWPDSQRREKFGAADLGIPVGRLEDAHRFFTECTQRHKLRIIGMNIYNEAPNRISPSISFAVYVNESDPSSVERFYAYVREMSELAVRLEGTMSTYIGDGDRLGGFNRIEHGDALDLMLAIKRVFDPHAVLNPGKKWRSRWIRENLTEQPKP